MKKSERQQVFDKYDGRCAYCGCILAKGWHVDHIEPLDRFTTENGKPKNVHLNCVENYNPSCASCNINKHSLPLEEFRKLIAGFIKHLNEISTQYKIAKRYGIVNETGIEVKFYFETFENNDK